MVDILMVDILMVCPRVLRDLGQDDGQVYVQSMLYPSR